MRKISLILQEVLKFFLIFLLCFVWLRYFIRKLWVAVLLTALTSVVVYLALFLIGRKKKSKDGLKLKEKEDAENIFLSLACEEKPMNFFAKLASKKHKNITKHKQYLVITHAEIPTENKNRAEIEAGSEEESQPAISHNSKNENSENRSNNSKIPHTASNTLVKSSVRTTTQSNSKTYTTVTKTLLYADLSFEDLNIARFMEIYNKIKKEKAEKIVICCKKIVDKQLLPFCANFTEKFLILDEYATYQKLYKYYDCYPKITKKYNSEKKMAFKDFVAYSFNKKRTKGYLFSAFVLILSGLFIRTTIYYCIIASLLVVFALVSQFNPYFNTKAEAEVL